MLWWSVKNCVKFIFKKKIYANYIEIEKQYTYINIDLSQVLCGGSCQKNLMCQKQSFFATTKRRRKILQLELEKEIELQIIIVELAEIGFPPTLTATKGVLNGYVISCNHQRGLSAFKFKGIWGFPEPDWLQGFVMNNWSHNCVCSCHYLANLHHHWSSFKGNKSIYHQSTPAYREFYSWFFDNKKVGWTQRHFTNCISNRKNFPNFLQR